MATNQLRRRQLLLAAGGLLASRFAHGQARPRVAVLAASTKSAAQHLMRTFSSRLEELGWQDGHNVAIDYRYANGDTQRLEVLAREIVATKPDVIFAPPEPAALAAQRATRDIPIVFAIASDPVGSGLAASLARPAGNATGLTNVNVELSAKRLQILKELSPAAERIAVFVNSKVKNTILQFKLAQEVAGAIGVQLLPVDIQNRSDLERAFDVMSRARADGFVVLADPLLFTERQWIAERARGAGLISLSAFAEYPEAGGLASYAVHFPTHFRRAAAYVDKILKGAKPGDLAIEQPLRLELVVNLKTARALRLTVPKLTLVRADRVID